MSWLFSRVLVEEYLGENSLDGEQCAPSSGNQMARNIPQWLDKIKRRVAERFENRRKAA